MLTKQTYTLIQIEDNCLNFETVTQLQETVNELIRNGKIHIILDLSRVDYVGSVAIGEFISIHKQIEKHFGEFKIIGVNEDVKRIFNITQLIKYINIHSQS